MAGAHRVSVCDSNAYLARLGERPALKLVA
jgi:hypothetical protein